MSQNAPHPAPSQVQPLAPCEHMTNLVSSLSDESLHGPARWYTRFHVATCPKCRAALEGLRDLRTQLQTLDDTASPPAGEPATLTSERQAHVTKAMDNIDSASP